MAWHGMAWHGIPHGPRPIPPQAPRGVRQGMGYACMHHMPYVRMMISQGMDTPYPCRCGSRAIRCTSSVTHSTSNTVCGPYLAYRPLHGPDFKMIEYSCRANVRRPLYILIPQTSEVSDEYCSTSGRLARHARHVTCVCGPTQVPALYQSELRDGFDELADVLLLGRQQVGGGRRLLGWAGQGSALLCCVRG